MAVRQIIFCSARNESVQILRFPCKMEISMSFLIKKETKTIQEKKDKLYPGTIFLLFSCYNANIVCLALISYAFIYMCAEKIIE